MPAYQKDLKEMVDMYESKFEASDYIDSTWGAFETARSNAAALVGAEATKAQADAARMALKDAECELLKDADKSRILEVCEEYEANRDHYSKDSWEAFKPVLDSVSAFAREEAETDKMTIQTQRVKLDKAARGLVEIVPVDSTVIPDEALLKAIKEQTGCNSAEMTIQTQRVKLDKAARGLVEIVPVDSTVIPDEALLKAIKEQTGCNSAEEMAQYEGELDLTGLPVKDLTGLETLKNLKGLTLKGTQVKEVLGRNIPKTVEKLDMSDCAELKTIDLRDGGYTNLKEANISGCEKLVLVYMNSVGLEKLDVSENGKYEKVYAVDLSGNKLDLSKETPEGKFVNKVEENLKANPPKALYNYNNVSKGMRIEADVMAGRHEEPEVMVDGDKTQLSGGYYLDNKGTATINLGETREISKVAVTYREKEVASEYKWEYSEDGRNFKEIVTVPDNKKASAEYVLEKPVKAHYIRYTTVNKGNGEAVILELEAFTREKVESNVKYTGQAPLLTVDYESIPAEIQITEGSEAVKIQDYMDKCYKESKTVRGTVATALKGQKWLAEDYDIDAMTKVPEGMKVVITGADGVVYEDPFNPEKVGTYTVEFKSQDDTVLATMTIKVSADKEALKAAIDAAKKLEEKNYTPGTWAPFAEALKAAEVLATMTIKVSADKEALKAAIDAAKKLEEKNYTPGTWAPFAEALKAAEEAYANEEATTEMVQNVVSALADATEKLVEKPSKDALKAAIDAAKELKEENYTPETWAPFTEALKAAEEVLANEEATAEMVQKAKDALVDATGKLVEVAPEPEKPSKDALKVAIDAANALTKEDYTEETWAPFAEALKAAEKVYADEEATVEDVEKAVTDLQEAQNNLVEVIKG